MGPQRMFGMTPWVRRLMVACLFVFLLQSTLFTSPAFVRQFGFNPLNALARPWTVLTYMFLHRNVLHLAFNMLALYVFGPSVEERMGGRDFLVYYLLCGFGGAMLSFGLLQLPQPMGPVIGASGADRKSTRLNSSHQIISYAVFCLKKKRKSKRISDVTAKLGISITSRN